MNNPLHPAALSITEDNYPENTQYITFGLSNYLFALPSQSILRVVRTPPPNQGGLVAMGMVQLGPYSIQIIDLESLLVLNSNVLKNQTQMSVSSSRALENRKKATPVDPDQHPSFLIVMQDAEKELWGIALHEPPDLIEVPDYALKPVPFSQRQKQSLKWISHIANYDLNSVRHSLLVLDLVAIMDPEGASLPGSEIATFEEIQPPVRPSSVQRLELPLQ
ncbi:MAG: hypothetical protein AAGN15_06825 [Cyanobacteria bacterium J06581_3]